MSTTLDLDAKFGDTTFSNFEVFMIGEALLSWIGTVARIGHASPASTLDYTTSPAALSLGGLIIRDFVAWTSGRVHLAEGCEERLRNLIKTGELDRHLAHKTDDVLRRGGAS